MSLMKPQNLIDEEAAWSAVMARDRTADGTFVTGVLTTGIYCRPSCAARHPRRENVRFFADGAAAARTGLRACLRCTPDEVTREAVALEKVYALIERAAQRGQARADRLQLLLVASQLEQSGRVTTRQTCLYAAGIIHARLNSQIGFRPMRKGGLTRSPLMGRAGRSRGFAAMQDGRWQGGGWREASRVIVGNKSSC